MVKQNIYDNQSFYDGYIKLRERECNYNDLLEKPAILEALGSKHYENALDLGCGFGKYTRILDDRGTTVTGVDISEKMIAKAREDSQGADIQFVVSSLEDFHYPLKQYDLVLSTLALHYVKDVASIFQQIFSSLVAEGEFVFTIEHPLTTASGERGWFTDDEGNKLFYKLDRYFERGLRTEKWIVDGVERYHRTISDYFYALKNCGFAIEDLVEIEPQGEARTLISEALRRPAFLLFKVIKP